MKLNTVNIVNDNTVNIVNDNVNTVIEIEYRVTQPCLVFLTGMLQRLPVLLRVPFSALFQYLL